MIQVYLPENLSWKERLNFITYSPRDKQRVCQLLEIVLWSTSDGLHGGVQGYPPSHHAQIPGWKYSHPSHNRLDWHLVSLAHLLV